MTPQERDLITAFFDRLRQQSGVQKDAEADTLIRQGLQQVPDAGYLLVQTVLIQDMALHEAQNRIAAYERQLAGQPSPAQGSSFLPQRAPGQGAAGSVPATGPWGPAAPEPPPASRPVWSQAPSAAPPPQSQYAPAPQQPPYGPPAYGGGYGPQMLAGGGGGFLRQAAATAAGVVGGSLLFQGISSMFGPHYGGGFMGGMPTQQPGLSETVINNYYGDQSSAAADDPGYTSNSGYTNAADNSNDPGYADQQNVADDQSSDFGGGDGGNYDA